MLCLSSRHYGGSGIGHQEISTVFCGASHDYVMGYRLLSS